MMPDEAQGPAAPPPRPCPICGKPSRPEHKPFCSRRCADVDLHRWLGGHYALPAKADDDIDDVPPEGEGG